MNIQTAQRDNPYNHIIRLGRILQNHGMASRLAEANPAEVLGYIGYIEKHIRFTKVSDFFSLFPPIKRYADDGMWDYNSALDMIEKELGTHFGKNDFKQLIMSHCYENQYVALIGFAFMQAVSEMSKRMGKQSPAEEFFEKQGVPVFYGPIE